MNNNTIIDTISIWTTAQKLKTSNRGRSASNQSLHGINKLRELILNLAMRGKLVPQNPNDEPASILLKKITKENEQLLNNGKKDFNSFKEIKGNEVIFILSDGWSWVRFGRISVIERGGSPRPIESYLTNDLDGLNWIKIGDTEIGGKYITSTKEKIRKEGLSKTRMVYSGDFLLTNSMSFGRPYITKIDGCIHDGWLRIHPHKALNKDFLYHLLSSSYVAGYFKVAAAGAVVLNLNAEKVRELPIPLPPLSEQHRIVAKVDELMALCDQLEQQQTDSNSAHEILIETLLDTLTNAPDQAELETSWQRITNHFDVLFTTEHSIDRLKQTILQLAVMGKLSEYSPLDEPVSKLLEKVHKGKKLIGEKWGYRDSKRKKLTNDSIINLPEHWKLAEISDLAWVKGGKRMPKGVSFSPFKTPYIYIRVTDMKNESVSFNDLQYIDEKIHKILARYIIEKEDLFVVIVGATIGKVGKLPIQLDGMHLTENAAKLMFQNLNQDYLLIVLQSKLIQEQFIEKTNQQAQPKLALERIETTQIPIPPLAEQHRIVSKVDELFAVCDALKERINESQVTQLNLADTLVDGAVG